MVVSDAVTAEDFRKEVLAELLRRRVNAYNSRDRRKSNTRAYAAADGAYQELNELHAFIKDLHFKGS